MFKDSLGNSPQKTFSHCYTKYKHNLELKSYFQLVIDCVHLRRKVLSNAQKRATSSSNSSHRNIPEGTQ